MFEFLHDGDLIVQGLFEIAVATDQFLLNSLDCHLSALIAGGLIHLTKRALAQTVALVDSVVLYLFDYVHLNLYI